MNIIDAFPIPISYIEKVINTQQATDIVAYCNDHQDIFTTHPKLNTYARTSYNSYQISKNTTFLNDTLKSIPSCDNLINDIQNIADKFTNNIGAMSCYVTDMLITIQDKGGIVLPHQHSRAAFSLVLYVNINEDSNGIYFYNPNPYTSLNGFVENNKYSHLYYKFNPNIGDAVIFPGWMSHGTHNEVNNMDNRIVLNFNFAFKD